ncbi:MAG: hypothetical protein WA700_13900 [Acidobacteriaceae bacterium]
MDRRHDNTLTDRLEDAQLHGCSHITWNELYHWYGVKKIAAGTCRDLAQRWQELTHCKEGQLMQIPGRDGIFIFAENRAKAISPDGDE